jgi:hypothetical protein
VLYFKTLFISTIYSLDFFLKSIQQELHQHTNAILWEQSSRKSYSSSGSVEREELFIVDRRTVGDDDKYSFVGNTGGAQGHKNMGEPAALSSHCAA